MSRRVRIGCVKLRGGADSSAADARFEILSANPPPPQAQNPNVRNLSLKLPEKTTATTITVLIAPADAPASPLVTQPLSQWAR